MEDIRNGLEFTFIRETKPPKELEELLIEGEHIEACYKTLRDFAIVTNYRFVIGDKQGITGKKMELYTIPFKSIVMYSSENAFGVFDLGEMEIWTRLGVFKLHLKKGVNVRELDKIISSHVL
ncbi:MAG: PH domain-containing protein [Candidatus Izimaplasma sp.]|nr:PH domain-containing protein [Candidatus Izimaplasma bacterium]